MLSSSLMTLYDQKGKVKRTGGGGGGPVSELRNKVMN